MPAAFPLAMPSKYAETEGPWTETPDVARCVAGSLSGFVSQSDLRTL